MSYPPIRRNASLSTKRVRIGSRVRVRGHEATVRYHGKVEYAKGDYFGVEMDRAVGKNNGTVRGKKYFECPKKHGLLVKAWEVEAIDSAPKDASTRIQASQSNVVAESETAQAGSPGRRLESTVSPCQRCIADRRRTGQTLNALQTDLYLVVGIASFKVPGQLCLCDEVR